jgi:hypothetical protein
MKLSLRGHQLPESVNDARELKYSGTLKYLKCSQCSVELYDATAATSAEGWRETQLSGMCESCFDQLFENDES